MASNSTSAAPKAVDSRFAKWQSVFDVAYRGLEKVRGDFTDAELASELGVTPGAFSNWRKRSVPKRAHIKKLALVFAHHDPVKSDELEKRFLEATGHHQIGLSPPLLRAQKGETVNVSVVKYSAFTDFFRELTDTLFKLAAVIPQQNPGGISLSEAADRLRDNKTDIVAAIFATPDRLKTMRFLDTPIRIGIGEIRPSSPTTGTDLPIVSSGEVGHIYTRHILGWREEQIRLVPYNASDFAQAYLNALRSPTQRCPVIYADDVMAVEVCVEILAQLKTERDTQRELWANAAWLPKIDIDTGDGSSLGAKRPHYYLGMAAYREDVDWFEFLNEAWEIFTRSNHDYIGVLYKKLREDLLAAQTNATVRIKDESEREDEFSRSRETLLSCWTSAIDRWLRLDPNSRDIVPYPWSKTIESAKPRQSKVS